jgi:Icc-related predicted phosphoesterase
MTPLDWGLVSIDVLLVVVDVAALVIGWSIRRTVSRIVSETADDIEHAVQSGIADALDRLTTLASALFATGKPDPSQVIEAARSAAEQLHEPSA